MSVILIAKNQLSVMEENADLVGHVRRPEQRTVRSRLPHVKDTENIPAKKSDKYGKATKQKGVCDSSKGRTTEQTSCKMLVEENSDDCTVDSSEGGGCAASKTKCIAQGGEESSRPQGMIEREAESEGYVMLESRHMRY